ncbi:hypothetical protein [Paragemmobacter straminiformis]|uniref:Uncharacterized protein n=1 Tax=Paragemmobacter straminiformis TaxID=2045119 RepID=A0A842IAC1_9RHOB|nr:hypothetical protein [Gemmobacter straminiformis]MBC2836595.1 hypothetical protein [Gemmobacter straminiformis]
MQHLPPADELAEIRAEIARLERREALLSHRLANSPFAALVGRFYRVEISHSMTRAFDPASLPDAIRNDPAYLRESHQTVVHTLPVAPEPAPLRPGWPIRRTPGVIARTAH